MMYLRGVRGAITIENNTPDEIYDATKELLTKLIEENSIELETIANVIFTCTSDLDSAYPAVAARSLGWKYVPMICLNEMKVEGSLNRVIRVLININTEKKQEEIKHIYLKGAVVLRADLLK